MSETSIEWTHPPGYKGATLRGRFGPPPDPPRDGDKKQARKRVNVLVRTGRIPRPNALPCTDCGHVWSPGERRHEYDHYLGYGAAHHLDVQPVCTTCHAQRDAVKTHCHAGHAFDASNTIACKDGRRACRACRRGYDKKRKRPPGYWSEVNRRRRARSAQ